MPIGKMRAKVMLLFQLTIFLPKYFITIGANICIARQSKQKSLSRFINTTTRASTGVASDSAVIRLSALRHTVRATCSWPDSMHPPGSTKRLSAGSMLSTVSIIDSSLLCPHRLSRERRQDCHWPDTRPCQTACSESRQAFFLLGGQSGVSPGKT